MKKLIIMLLAVVLVGCGKSDTKPTEEIKQLDNKSINELITVTLNNEYEMNDYSDLVSAMVEDATGTITGNDISLKLNIIEAQSVINIIEADPTFKSELYESIENGKANELVIQYLTKLYGTTIQKSVQSASAVMEDRSTMIKYLFNMYVIGVVDGIVGNYYMTLDQQSLDSLKVVSEGESISLGYYGENSILFTANKILSGDKALEYLGTLASTNSLKRINNETEINVVEFTIQNLTGKEIPFKSQIDGVNSSLLFYERNNGFEGSVNESTIPAYQNETFISIVVGRQGDTYVVWSDELTSETFRLK